MELPDKQRKPINSVYAVGEYKRIQMFTCKGAQI